MFSRSHPARISLIAMLVLSVLVFGAGAASAQTDDIDPYTEVENVDIVDPGTGVVPNVVTPAVESQSVSRGSALPMTGSEIMLLVGLGLGLVGGGAAALIVSRRRHALT